MNKILVIYKKSTFELYSNSRDKDIRLFIQGNHQLVERFRKGHDANYHTLEIIANDLTELGIEHEVVYRGDVMGIEGADLLVSSGGDGTFLDISHYIRAQQIPILGVNSDPGPSKGFFCCFSSDNFRDAILNLDRLPKTTLNRLELVINGTPIKEQVLNDVLIAHENPAAMSRFLLSSGGISNEYRGSGLLISTSSGSSAWMYEEKGQVIPIDREDIQYLVRGIRDAKPAFANELLIESFMREGKSYIDGEHLAYKLSLGDKLLARRGLPLTVIGDLNKKRCEYK